MVSSDSTVKGRTCIAQGCAKILVRFHLTLLECSRVNLGHLQYQRLWKELMALLQMDRQPISKRTRSMNLVSEVRWVQSLCHPELCQERHQFFFTGLGPRNPIANPWRLHELDLLSAFLVQIPRCCLEVDIGWRWTTSRAQMILAWGLSA